MAHNSPRKICVPDPPNYNEIMSTAAAVPSPDVLAKYEAVIGLEVHVQLATRTKIFCGCPTSFGAPPNTNVCPVCLGLPGALPVLSKPAVELAIKAVLALNCRINPVSRFARKNYFYPDLPKGYQISQYDQPLAEHGFVDIVVNGAPKRIGVTRVHMEDDAGKSIHDGFKDSDRYSYVDLNRCGTPLIEIVSEPDMRSSDEAYAYLTELKQMHAVHRRLRPAIWRRATCAATPTSRVRLRGAEKFGTKAEVKNLNSFRFLKLALDYEIARQVALIESGGRVVQETRLYNPDLGETVEHAQQGTRARLPLLPRARSGPAAHQRAWLRTRSQRKCRSCPRARRTRFIESLRSSRIRRRRCSPRPAPRSEYFETRRDGLRRSQSRRQLGDGRSDGVAQSRRQRHRRFARHRRRIWANWSR